MSNHQRTGGPGGSKSGPSSGISAELVQLRSRLTQLENLVKESLSEKNLWNAEVRSWVGKTVRVGLMTGAKIDGVLQWMDRYTICLLAVVDKDPYIPEKPHKVVIHKGTLVYIYLNE
jgi:small nuclear ribonucleoprotein (snRNP)-like protein